jgi:hypothetical protein
MRRVVGATTVVFWASGTLMAVLVVLSRVAPGLQEERFFLTLGGAAAGLMMVTSAFLFWHERRADRQELRASRQESRDIPWSRTASGRPKRGSSSSPSASPLSSRGTSCHSCSSPDSTSFRGEASTGTGALHHGQKQDYSPNRVEEKISPTRMQNPA